MAVRKVVITGIGAISPYGVGVNCLMEALHSERSAVISQRREWQKELHDLTCWV